MNTSSGTGSQKSSWQVGDSGFVVFKIVLFVCVSLFYQSILAFGFSISDGRLQFAILFEGKRIIGFDS